MTDTPTDAAKLAGIIATIVNDGLDDKENMPTVEDYRRAILTCGVLIPHELIDEVRKLLEGIKTSADYDALWARSRSACLLAKLPDPTAGDAGTLKAMSEVTEDDLDDAVKRFEKMNPDPPAWIVSLLRKLSQTPYFGSGVGQKHATAENYAARLIADAAKEVE